MATITTHPTSNGTALDWDVTDYTNIDDGDEQPTAPSDLNSCYVAGLGGPSQCEWVTSNPSVTGTASNVSLWVYVSAGTMQNTNVKVDGIWQTTNATIASSVGNWDRYDFTITNDLTGGLTDCQIRCGCETNVTVDGAYLEWTYNTSTVTGSPWHYYRQMN